MSPPRIGSARIPHTDVGEADVPPGRKQPADQPHSVSRHPEPSPLTRHLTFAPASREVAQAPNVAEATKLANELAPLIAGHHVIEYRLIRILRDDEGHSRRVEQQGTVEVDIVPGKAPIRVDPSNSASYGLTPVLSTESFELSLPRADERGVVDTARTMVHEWGHTSLNRMINQSGDPKRVYAIATEAIGLWESLSFKSPSTGEFVKVTPTTNGVTTHEMVGQYAGALFDKALASRKAGAL